MGTFGSSDKTGPQRLGQRVRYGGFQRQNINNALTGNDVNVADITRATSMIAPPSGPMPPVTTQPMQSLTPQQMTPMAPLPQTVAPPMTPIQQQVQYAGGTQQAIDDAMTSPGVTIADLIRRIANRPRF